jgi:hypothetical protein
LEVYAAPVSAEDLEVLKLCVFVAGSVGEEHIVKLSAVYF